MIYSPRPVNQFACTFLPSGVSAHWTHSYSSDAAFAPSHDTTHGKAVVFPADRGGLACSKGRRVKPEPRDNDAIRQGPPQAGWRIFPPAHSVTGHGMGVIN